MESVKNIKILFISHEYCIGGATRSLMSMIQGFGEEDKVNIEVLLPYKRNGRAKELLRGQGICFTEMLFRNNIKPLKVKYNLKYLIFDILNYLSVKKTVQYIKKEKFDIICSNSTAVDIGSRAAALLKIPHIYYAREMMEEGVGATYRHKKQMHNLLRKADTVVCISKIVEQYYKSIYHLQNTCWFYNGFILDDYFIKDHEILKNNGISFIQVGGFMDEKGTLKTIEMLHLLNQMGIKNWNIEFVGGGTEEYILRMKKLIERFSLQSQIIIEDYCMNIKEKLSSKDILIINSQAEGFGRVAIEGMLAGCLVVGKSAGGVAEIINNDKNGLLFRNIEEFPILIKKVANNKKLFKEMAKKGQEYALNFSNIICAAKFLNVVKKCLRNGEKI